MSFAEKIVNRNAKSAAYNAKAHTYLHICIYNGKCMHRACQGYAAALFLATCPYF